MAVIEPEMCGKIIDESHYKFHVECKSKIISAIHRMSKGFDFVKTLAGQNFTVNPEWTKNSCNDPNIVVLKEILEEYKKNEHRPTRAKVIVPLIEYAIGLYASDLFYRERGEWFMYQLIKRSDRMRFGSVFIDPEQWYPKSRRLVRDKKGNITTDHYAEENSPNAMPIEQEYMIWYNIDATKDFEDISPELKAQIIAENQQYMKDNKIPFKRKT